MNYLSAIILGIIQGLAEFLPISSSGHLALAHNFFGLADPESSLTFDIILHLGTLIAVFVVYYKDIGALIVAFFTGLKKLFKGKFKLSEYNVSERFVFFILIATLPLVVLAFTPIKDKIELLSQYPVVIGAILLLNGLVLLISDRISNGTVNAENNKPLNAFLVGIFQMFAIVPGLSRSGSTITGGLLRNYDREYAVKFSFILSIPAIIGANILSIPDVINSNTSSEMIPIYLVGLAAAALSGLLAIKLLHIISKKANFTAFSYYCFAVGLFAIIYGSIKG